MAVDTFAVFIPSTSTTPLVGESATTITDPFTNQTVTPVEISDFSDEIEQNVTIGSGSSGAGAGKVTFDPFKIQKTVDVLTPTFFEMCAAGTHFSEVHILFRKATGGSTSGVIYLAYAFKLVFIKTIAWSLSDEGVNEVITLEAGAQKISYYKQKPDGTLMAPITQQWSQVTNSNTFDVG